MTPTLTLKNISKLYGVDFFANHEVNFQLFKGQIHALVGENGAGKTTLMEILFGLEAPSSGEIFVHDAKVRIDSPIDAKKFRIAMVHQHFMLENQLTVRDHLQLEINSSLKTWGFFRNLIQEGQILQLMQSLKLSIDLDMPIAKLSVVEKQKIEILKTLLFDPEILIFDEPTAVLPPEEVEAFYQMLRELKTSGKSIALITHKLADVVKHCDFVTVLRHGKVRFQSIVSKTTTTEIARYMIGSDSESTSSENQVESELKMASFKLPDVNRPAPLIIRNFSNKVLKKIDLHVDHGEIVAFAGVEGNGQNALIEMLIRPDQIESPCEGFISMLGLKIIENARHMASSTEIRRLSLGYIGPDRLTDSAVVEFNLADHFRLLPHYRDEFRLKAINERILVDAQNELDIRPKNIELNLGQFSGGNQQKWVVGRETSHYPELLLACHPTRGVDFSATQKIHNILRGIRHRNRSVALLSSDIDEILALSDRVYVFFDGQIKEEFRPPYDRGKIGQAFGGANLESKSRGDLP